MRIRSIIIQTLAATAAIVLSSQTLAFGAVTRQDQGPIAQQVAAPVYVWQDFGHKPKAIVLAIHGLSLHGTVYDAWARDLAQHGIVVAAPDLRGFGSWYASKKETSARYTASERDLIGIAHALRARYRGVPLILAGESLGGSLAIKMAATHPDLVDGLILSAPAIKHQYHVPLGTIADASLVVTNPKRKVDISGFIKHYFSERSEVTQEEMSDPLVRKRLSLGELLSSCRVIAATKRYISQIPTNLPVLILQGQKDQMVDVSSVEHLSEQLTQKQTTIRMFAQRGHILLETQSVDSETLGAVDNWIAGNCKMRTIGGASVAAAEEELIPTWQAGSQSSHISPL